MMKDAVRALETGAFAEIGVLAFFVAFLLIVVYALTLSKRSRDAAKQIPLDDLPDAFPSHTTNGNPA